MVNRCQGRVRVVGSSHDGTSTTREATAEREQATRPRVELETGTLTGKPNRPQITLSNGAIVDAREAVVIVEWLRVTLARRPDEFQSLLALAEGRLQDANPRHFEELWARAFLTNDRTIEPTVREVLLNCYQITPEGPVVVPLRLKDAADLPAAAEAQRGSDRFLRDILRGRIDDHDRSPD